MMLNTLKQREFSKAQYINNKCVSLQHEDNFYLLQLLIPHQLEKNQTLICELKNKPKLILLVKDCFKYTVEFELKYQFKNSVSESVVIRNYLDAKVAELMYCTDFQRFIRLMGPKISPHVHFKTRMSLNRFLDKWLNYLLQNGYNASAWKSLDNPNDSI